MSPERVLTESCQVQVKDVEETGKLESSDRLNLEATNSAGLGGAAAGAGVQSEASLSRRSEMESPE